MVLPTHRLKMVLPPLQAEDGTARPQAEDGTAPLQAEDGTAPPQQTEGGIAPHQVECCTATTSQLQAENEFLVVIMTEGGCWNLGGLNQGC